MTKGSFRRLPPYFLPFFGVGAAAGFINGLLGAGGGIILILLLPRLAKKHRIPACRDMQSRDWYATALSVMLPATVVSAVIYFLRGGIADKHTLFLLFLPAAAGGAAGAWLLGRIDGKWLKRLFSILVIISGVRMILK